MEQAVFWLSQCSIQNLLCVKGKMKKIILIKESLDAQILGCGGTPARRQQSRLAEGGEDAMGRMKELAIILMVIEDCERELSVLSFEYREGYIDTEQFRTGVAAVVVRLQAAVSQQ
jgi:hypothetical protein